MPAYLLVEVAKREFVGLPGFKIVQSEPGEVRNQDVSGKVPLFQPREIVGRLGIRPVEILTA